MSPIKRLAAYILGVGLALAVSAFAQRRLRRNIAQALVALCLVKRLLGPHLWQEALTAPAQPLARIRRLRMAIQAGRVRPWVLPAVPCAGPATPKTPLLLSIRCMPAVAMGSNGGTGGSSNKNTNAPH
jgi:hypothetical protein